MLSYKDHKSVATFFLIEYIRNKGLILQETDVNRLAELISGAYKCGLHDGRSEVLCGLATKGYNIEKVKKN